MRTTVAIAVSILLVCINLNAECLLRGVQYLETGSERADMTVADFNHDGFPDVAVVGPEAGVMRVFVNQSDGSFVISNEKDLKIHPQFVRAGDFNGDAVPDLAVAGSGGLVILINDGTGKFTIAQHIGVTAGSALVVADFNSDSIADLALLTTKGTSGVISVFLSVRGSLTKTLTLPVKAPSDLIAAPLGSSRTVDLVASSDTGTITVFKSSGAGTFQETAHIAAVPGARQLTSGFIDGDNRMDLVVAGADGQIAILLGQNEDDFKRIQISTSSEIQGLALADFNNDHHTDLLLVNRNSLSSLYAGNGHGSFAFAHGFSFGLFTGALVTADFNRDGMSDFVAAEAGSAGVFLGNGKSSFAIGARTVLKGGGNILSGDFDGDGFPDLVISGTTGSTMLRGKGNGTFYPPEPAALPQLGYSAVTDLDGDGRDDLIGFNESILTAWLSDDKAQFRETAAMRLPMDPPIQTLDLNGDGLPDLAVMMPNRLNVYFNQRNGQFSKAQSIYIPEQDRGVMVDLNGDGTPDLVTIPWSNKKALNVYLGGPKLSFTKHAVFPLGGCPGLISTGDANGDGKADIVVGSSCEGQVTLLLGDGTGGFSSIVNAPSGGGSYDPKFADFDGDGKQEIFTIARDPGKLSISIAPAFDQYQLVGPFYWNRAVEADFDRDGHPDIAVSSYSSTAVFLNCQ